MNIEHLLPLVWNMWIVIFKSDLRLPPSVLRSSSSAHAQKFSWNNAESSSWPLWRASVRFWLRPSEVVTLGTVAPSYMAGIVDPNSKKCLYRFLSLLELSWGLLSDFNVSAIIICVCSWVFTSHLLYNKVNKTYFLTAVTNIGIGYLAFPRSTCLQIRKDETWFFYFICH